MLLSGVLFVLFLDGCWLYCLADAALTPAEEFRGLSKITWLCIIVATFIVGAIAWLIARRSWRARSWAASQGTRPASPTSSDTDPAWFANWMAFDGTDGTGTDGTGADGAGATDAAVARHPAGRSKKPAQEGWIAPKGPDDDVEFLRLLDRRIHGTSPDSGE
jgi:hypothetical protein